jgi:hypothetical protein
MKKIFAISILFLLFAFSSTKTNDIGFNDPKVYTITDDLECTWAVVYAGRYDGGVYMVHHPKCKNNHD